MLSYMERRFIAEAHADFAEKLEAAELDTEQKQKSNYPSGQIASLLGCGGRI
ncbi:hypothetical protein [Rhizobium mongolense]|uniref:Uncharacterized protein n=1 Tax=Rhizobium mongolense TaxID=57676 RepID=A0A7W6RLV0_9HYPH|nr:hypothetical protein [Rhizobium mongolense]MBB4274885.1 hypothetical protein [Rhizobium mongolense]